MAELLIELLSEEIPARMQRRAADDLRRLVTEGLKKAGLAFETAQAFCTPRRLALAIDGLPLAQPDTREERKGPKADAPEKAIQGFLGSVGLTLDQVERRETPKGPVLFAVIEHKGRPTADVLPALIYDAIVAMPWPKSMRWSANGFAWVRPLHSIVAVFDGAPLTGGLALGATPGARSDGTGPAVSASFVPDPAQAPDGITVLPYGAETRGHRFLAPASFAVRTFKDYCTGLGDACVMLETEQRAAVIEERAAALAAAEGLRVKPDPGLLDEVAGLVEWPEVLMGRIDDAFMDVPPEVLTTTMRGHQKYFSLETAEGALAPRFIVVANTRADDGGARIVAGNERVLRARLSDARFFWDQDRKTPLAERVEQLRTRVFHARLGTDHDKMERMRAVAAHLAGVVPGADADLCDRAVRLCKADLTTGMVGEFPELQGVMGRYYARHDGERGPVAEAVADHYSPLGPSDRCPRDPVSIVVALADKIDTLVGFWMIDEKPTGSRDPFALRRAALGVIRLVVENGLRLPLLAAFGASRTAYIRQAQERVRAEQDTGAAATTASAEMDRNWSETALDDLLAFFADRLKVHLRDRGVRHDLIAAVFALGDEDDLVRLLARVDALARFVDSDDGANLLTAYRRAANIVRIEERKDVVQYAEQDVAADLLNTDEETSLFSALSDTDARTGRAVEAERFEEAMAALAALRAPVDAFFDTVTVNADDPSLRRNRLRLLSRIELAMSTVADFSKIEG
ncbi:glycine--tRNA ligase subunit beta [Roseospira marina]|uniref:Glycine--tRNA ligase beta subunit n=1 Tax=Roseospira marina TaxID=140057 RepID=A0A5M6IFJ3_9PROT|nr:glycine--tRNA ligase subunit beta [Roseospira marina]KAA5607051.1 glycine--tRNA ligase subunit beta [Roseospira marina]MBB4312761.1 glycyl-tRNA synthetase beta chain [Roseospira marina]MBB5086466.1 glycyl-tRNA synthetase beta chain [Roseospira marina]